MINIISVIHKWLCTYINGNGHFVDNKFYNFSNVKWFLLMYILLLIIKVLTNTVTPSNGLTAEQFKTFYNRYD